MTGKDFKAGGGDDRDSAENDPGGDSPGRSLNGLLKSAAGRLARPFRRRQAEADTKDGGAAQCGLHAVLQQNLLRMAGMRVSSAMVPRADIVGIEAGVTLEEALEAFRNCGHSRLPVFQDTLDDPIGFIHVKDLFMEYGFDCPQDAAAQFDARRRLRKLLTVPPSMPCVNLLQTMQAQRVHMALVIDEYGGVDGLLTIEDLLELIVGEIDDEYDAATVDGWTREADGVYLADARAYLDEFEQETGVRLIDPEKVEDVDTLGGLVFMLCNRVPARGEVVRHPDGHELEVLDADPRRIKRLRVTLADVSGPRDGGEGSSDFEPLPQAAQ